MDPLYEEKVRKNSAQMTFLFVLITAPPWKDRVGEKIAQSDLFLLFCDSVEEKRTKSNFRPTSSIIPKFAAVCVTPQVTSKHCERLNALQANHALLEFKR